VSFIQALGTQLDKTDSRQSARLQKGVCAMERIGPQRGGVKKIPPVHRDVITLSIDETVRLGFLQDEKTLPLMMEPKIEAIDLPAWIGLNVEFVNDALLKYGGILFRGFDINSQEEFDRTARSILMSAMPYIEGATPRTQLSDSVYTSTEFPPSQHIDLHNELSYVTTWPMKILFFCLTPCNDRGETPIADVRNVYKRISPKTVERFKQKNWMLLRNYGNGMSLPWQKVFRTESNDEVESYCREALIDYEWVDKNHLRTRQVRPSIARHPRTSEIVWFNHIAFWHVTSLRNEVRESMLTVFNEYDLPYNTYYGDGSPIEPSVLDELRSAYNQEKIIFQWQKGDVLLLDNMLVAHGRNPFSGPRRILVSMGEPCSERGV
jgi:alpha-ketoglutarate-dependent taurine dioxygenase